MKLVRPCLVVTAFLLVVCCALYPALITVAAQAIFPRQANGSLIERNGEIVGSSLIGQTLEKPAEHPEYFWGRPSAASADSATGVIVSSGSNYGPMNAALKDEVAQRIATLREAGVTGAIPVDLVTKSASGLDPHISVAAAELQIPRVAKARAMPEAEVRAMVERHTEGRTMGLFGEPRVNVLELNLDLDARAPRPAG
ncbi:MAG: potassium-transporting ATPase subunit KdpC [Polyangiaceae bacterium]|nr:potassium-transporting ATPase subunit KdpC [Polyangiaceae bacterium]